MLRQKSCATSFVLCRFNEQRCQNGRSVQPTIHLQLMYVALRSIQRHQHTLCCTVIESCRNERYRVCPSVSRYVRTRQQLNGC
jgi:hypothetical protein